MWVESGAATLDLRVTGTASIAARIPGLLVASLQRLGAALNEFTAIARPNTKDEIRIPYLTAGAYVFVALGQYGQQARRDIELAEGQHLDLEGMSVVPFPVVPVHLVLPPGAKRPPSIQVDFQAFTDGRGGMGPGPGRIEFDGNDKAWLKGLPPGEFVVSLSVPGLTTWRGTISVEASPTRPIEIEVRAP